MKRLITKIWGFFSLIFKSATSNTWSFYTQAFIGIQTLLIGGTSILIVVSVVIEMVRTLEVQLVSKNYDRFVQ